MVLSERSLIAATVSPVSIVIMHLFIIGTALIGDRLARIGIAWGGRS